MASPISNLSRAFTPRCFNMPGEIRSQTTNGGSSINQSWDTFTHDFDIRIGADIMARPTWKASLQCVRSIVRPTQECTDDCGWALELNIFSIPILLYYILLLLCTFYPIRIEYPNLQFGISFWTIGSLQSDNSSLFSYSSTIFIYRLLILHICAKYPFLTQLLHSYTLGNFCTYDWHVRS